MALKGKIGNFGLADILQLIASGNRSGQITLGSDEDEFEVNVKDGWIMSASSTMRPGSAALGSRLVRAGLMSHSQFGQVLGRRAKTDEDIGMIMIDMGLIKEEILQHYATLQATDILFDIFTWTSGTYEFKEGEIEPEPSWVTPISAEYLLVNGVQLKDDWAQISKLISNFQKVVEKRLALPARTEDMVMPFDEAGVPIEPPNPLEVDDDERVIHQLCLPGTDLKTIIDRSPIGKFETIRRVYHLVEGGWVFLSD